MTPLVRGLVIALVQALILGAVAGKLLYDRQTLPSAWVPTTGVDPMLPVRGRYVSLYLVVEVANAPDADDLDTWTLLPAELSVQDGALKATALARPPDGVVDFERRALRRLETPTGSAWVVADPVAFFLPEQGPDPSALQPGEVLWAQVTVPRDGAPRPIRLEVRQDDVPAPAPSPGSSPEGTAALPAR
jgi:hypothetical protein